MKMAELIVAPGAEAVIEQQAGPKTSCRPSRVLGGSSTALLLCVGWVDLTIRGPAPVGGVIGSLFAPIAALLVIRLLEV
jgi:hypothetical protein